MKSLSLRHPAPGSCSAPAVLQPHVLQEHPLPRRTPSNLLAPSACCPCHTLQLAHTSPDPASQGTSGTELSAATHAGNVQQPSNYLAEKAEEGGSPMGGVCVPTAVACQPILGSDGKWIHTSLHALGLLPPGYPPLKFETSKKKRRTMYF